MPSIYEKIKSKSIYDEPEELSMFAPDYTDHVSAISHELATEGKLGPKIAPTRSRWDEFVDAVARGTARVGSAGMQLMASMGRGPLPTAPGMPVPKPLPLQHKAKEELVAKGFEDKAKFLWEVSKNPGLAARNKDLASKALNLIGETIPYITATTAAYTAGGTMGGFMAGSLVEGNISYRNTIDHFIKQNKGKPLTPEQLKQAETIGVGVGLVAGAVEAFGGKGAEKLLLKATSKLKSKLAKAGAVFTVGTVVEALEEGAQEVAQITGEETYRDVDWNERVNRTLGSMAGGAFLGGAMRGGSMAAKGQLFGHLQEDLISPAEQAVMNKWNGRIEERKQRGGTTAKQDVEAMTAQANMALDQARESAREPVTIKKIQKDLEEVTTKFVEQEQHAEMWQEPDQPFEVLKERIGEKKPPLTTRPKVPISALPKEKPEKPPSRPVQPPKAKIAPAVEGGVVSTHPLGKGLTHQQMADMDTKEYADEIHNPADDRIGEINARMDKLRERGGDYAQTKEWKNLKEEKGQLIRITGNKGLPQAGQYVHEEIAAKQAQPAAEREVKEDWKSELLKLEERRLDRTKPFGPRLEKRLNELRKKAKDIESANLKSAREKAYKESLAEISKGRTRERDNVVAFGKALGYSARKISEDLSKAGLSVDDIEGALKPVFAKQAQPPAAPKMKKIGRPGFIDLTPIAEAGEQIRTKAQAAGKGLTRFTGVEKKVQKVLIEYEEQMRELPKVAARENIKKFGKLTEGQEIVLENYRELGKKYPEKYKLPPELKGDYDTLVKTLDEYNKRREALGYPGDWPETKIKGLEKKLEKLRKREESEPDAEGMLEDAIEGLRDLRYLHHQYKPAPMAKRARQWFRRKISKKPRGVLGRKIPTYEIAEKLGLERAPLAVSMAHYQHEIERAEAADALIKAINNNPNLSQWAEDAPEGWVTLSPDIFPDSVQRMMWAEEGKVGQKFRRRKYPVPIADALEELTYARDSHAMARWYDKTNFALKIVGFYNPLVMTKNDLVQMWRGTGVKGFVKLPKAIEIFARKGEEYETLRKAGLFNNVVNYTPAVKELTQQMLDKIRLSKGERAAKIAGEWLNPKNFLQDIRKFNEATTWNLDEIIRISAYEAFKDSRAAKGLTEFEKIEYVNDALVNYAKLPKGTKTWLSRFFFVPTYRVGNFRYFWGQVAKHPWRYKGPLLRTVGYKMFVQWGLPALIAGALAWKLKDKKEVWTEKGYRVAIHNPKTGRDTVYALSDPLLEGAKVTQRTLRHTFNVNLAALPHLAGRILRGPRYKNRDPYGEFLKIGTPFYRDVVNWTDPDKTTHQKILTQLAVAYVYSRKHKPKDDETALSAYAKALSIWTNWKEQKQDVEKMLGSPFYSLMSDKEIREEISNNTYKKPYRRDGRLYRRGEAHKGQEEHVRKLREVLKRRAK